jgi:hypothetical protein
MMHRIIIPSAGNHTIELPQKYFGKRVMVTVLALDEKVDKCVKAEEARAFFNSIQVDMTDFKFNRDEAHER